MKIRYFLILLVFNLMLPTIGQEAEKKDIISFIEFPKPNLDFGRLINDPFLGLNIYNDKIDEASIKQKIKNIEKGLSKSSNPQDYYDLGNYYTDLNNYDKGIKYYKMFLDKSDEYDLDLKDLQKMTMLGDVYFSISKIDTSYEISNLERSLFLFTKAVELNPDDQNLLMKLGDCYLSLNRTAEALSCYNKILKNNNEDFFIYAKLQAASFQGDYIRFIYNKAKEKIDNQNLFQNFDYIQTAINNAEQDLKESLTLQYNIYLLRLLLIKNDYPTIINLPKDEDQILDEAENLLKNINSKWIKKNNISYLLGIVNYLKKDYIQALSEFTKSLTGNKTDILRYDDMLFINIFLLNNDITAKNIIYDLIKKYPDPKYYMMLSYIEMQKNETLNAEMLCAQALSIKNNYGSAYSGLSVIYAMKGNYAAADDMLRKGIFHIHDEYPLNTMLYTQMKINEAVIALLKNENERAKIILQSVISTENNDKAIQLYTTIQKGS